MAPGPSSCPPKVVVAKGGPDRRLAPGDENGLRNRPSGFSLECHAARVEAAKDRPQILWPASIGSKGLVMTPAAPRPMSLPRSWLWGPSGDEGRPACRRRPGISRRGLQNPGSVHYGQFITSSSNDGRAPQSPRCDQKRGRQRPDSGRSHGDIAVQLPMTSRRPRGMFRFRPSDVEDPQGGAHEGRSRRFTGW